MVIGVPKEIKADENRVALAPSGAAAFIGHGHHVVIEKSAGVGSGISDDAYREAGARIVNKPKSVWEQADMVFKVKEPLGDELNWMRPGQIIYTFLHLASNKPLTRALLARKVIALGYETVQLEDGTLPLLAPMSEVAGRLAVQKGAQCLEAGCKGRGILLSGVSGVKPANVVVLGAGTAGGNACQTAVGMGAHVTALDVSISRLRYLHDVMQGHITTIVSNSASIAEEIAKADLVIGAALIPGGRTPVLITKKMVRDMKPGSAILDIAIDQGGVCETSRPTTHHDPISRVHDVVHYCVTNMPGAVPRTSTYALTNATLGYGLEIADKGVAQAIEANPALRKGLNTHLGKLTHRAVADALDMEYFEV